MKRLKTFRLVISQNILRHEKNLGYILDPETYILDTVKNWFKMVFLTVSVCDFYPHKMHDIIQAEFANSLIKVLLYLQREMVILFQTFLQGRKKMAHTG